MERWGSLLSSKESTKDTNLRQMNPGHNLTPYSCPVRFLLCRPRILAERLLKSLRPSVRLSVSIYASTNMRSSKRIFITFQIILYAQTTRNWWVRGHAFCGTAGELGLFNVTNKNYYFASRSFFCDKTLGRRDNVTDHCTSDSQCHSLSSQSHFVHKMRDSVGLFQCRCYLDSSAATKTTVSNVNNQSWAELVFLFHTHTYSPTGVTERGFVSQTNLNSTKNTSDLLRFDRGPR